MKPDLANRTDLERVVNRFYEHVLADAQLAPFFNEHFRVHFNKHLPRMYDYWENVMLHTGTYNGNPMRTHQLLHAKHPLAAADFRRWLELFFTTVDELYLGPQARELKVRARNIAFLMESRVTKTLPNDATYAAMLPDSASQSPPEKEV